MISIIENILKRNVTLGPAIDYEQFQHLGLLFIMKPSEMI